MYPISTTYNEYLKHRAREWLVKVDVAGKEYGSNVVVDFTVENAVAGQEQFELGTTILSKLVLRLKTTDEIPPNARVVPYVAIKLPPEMDGANVAWQAANVAWQDAAFPWTGAQTEWLPLGEFFVDRRQQLKDVWEFTCYDKLYLADVPYVSQLTYPATMRQVWDEICARLGYTYDSSVVINSSYMIQAGPAGYTCRQVLGYIASANAACVYIGKDGIVRFRRFGATDQPVLELTTSDYIRAKKTNPLKTFTRVEVTYNTEDGLTYSAGSGGENQTLKLENPFMTQQMTTDLYNRLNGYNYVPVEIDARGYPQIEVGDRFRFGKDVGTITWNTADTAWNATDYSWDGFEDGGHSVILKMTYVFRGGLKMSIAAPSKSEQQSEFVVEGTLTQQINRLNQNAVREGRSYYGLTITRTDGLIVQREDQLSKAVFNSDELSFYAGNDRALWFDLPSRKFKFSGTLEAADGIFSGNLQAAGGTFKGALQAATGTFAGALQAASGTFTGDLVAAGGTFSGNLQAAGGTFKGELQAATGTFGGVYTGRIDAGQINVGVLNGFTITSAFINGGIITGSVIQTSSASAKISLEPSGFRSFDSSGVKRISIDSDSFGYHELRFFGQGAAQVGVISGTDGQFNIAGVGSASVLLGGSTIVIGGASAVNFQNRPVYNFPISNVTGLQLELNSKVSYGSTTSAHTQPDHNHGIPPGTRLAVVDVSGNIIGSVIWSASGGFTHYHTV